MGWFGWYWNIVIPFIFFILFLPVEIMALRDGKPGGTLSEWVWHWLYPQPDEPHYRYRRWLRIALAGGLGWVSIHLLTGWF